MYRVRSDAHKMYYCYLCFQYLTNISWYYFWLVMVENELCRSHQINYMEKIGDTYRED